MIRNNTKIRVLKDKIEIVINEDSHIDLTYQTDKLKVYPHTPYGGIEYQSYGILGIVNSTTAKHLIFITEVEQVGDIQDVAVYEIKKTHVISYGSHISYEEVRCLKKFLSLPGFYISEYDLTNGDNEFVFNYKIKEKFEEDTSGMYKGVSCIQGYFGNCKDGEWNLCLISRRSWKRAGTRLWMRGVDEEGNAANYVETEQILHNQDTITRHIQVRGSIPFKWGHKVGIEYKPPLIIYNDDITKSNDIIMNKYKNVYYMNLVQSVGYDAPICSRFTKALIKNNYRHGYCDYNGNKVYLSQQKQKDMVEKLKPFLNEFGIFYKKNGVEEKQEGVIRTNCIDCLDRTNLVQFLIAQEVLLKQTEKMNIKDNIRLGQHLRELWYNNGNAISMQYAGTPALKKHIILDSKQTIFGTINDLSNASQRYFINRFSDGGLQTGYDMFTGRCTDMVRIRSNTGYISYALLFFTISIILISFITKQYAGKQSKVYGVIIGFIILYISTFLIFFKWFVDKPLYSGK
ncbi:Phosphatidylinositide phosphatase SAC1 [Astathelohania contejeani]|uniref:Phosphatidylinositide phosphatase SAC1 n=1 Tax=Astathelohania contejeani TaxID=164912 RepID=A0ABQ7HZM9_9MICR|nr:Phosphatidylinositide phosphatase SAC1 [Thelohania contejeani]